MAKGGQGRASALLLVGVVAGLALAGSSIVERRIDRRAALGEGLIAQINSVGLSREAYEAQVEALASDKRNPMTEADRDHVLERMIEEELLIQRGVEIGLVERSRPVRAAIADAMIAALTAETQAEPVTEKELRAYYDDNRAYFSRAPHLQVATIKLKPDLDDTALSEALAAGASFQDVKAQFGAPQIIMPPQTLLPLAKLRDYVGPSLLDAALQAEPGVLTGPIETPGGKWLVMVVARDFPDVPPFEDIRDVVEQAWRKEQGDQALRDYLEWLKARAQVVRGR